MLSAAFPLSAFSAFSLADSPSAFYFIDRSAFGFALGGSFFSVGFSPALFPFCHLIMLLNFKVESL
jgi:hypothetical protein